MKTQEAWRVLLGMFLVALLATGAFPIDVKTDYDRTANFGWFWLGMGSLGNGLGPQDRRLQSQHLHLAQQNFLWRA